MNIILASQSPRRTEILSIAGIKHQVIPSHAEEIIDESLPIELVPESIAFQKAMDIYKTHEDDVVIGADTIVVSNNQILCKPKSKEDAFSMLKSFSNNVHEVITGVCIISKKEIKKFHVITKVYVDNLTDEQINDYIETEDIYDKAGAYGIQGIFMKYIKKIDGSYQNVMGLPIFEVCKALEKIK